jgi:exo-beta-1,3-glucanase (GH17 family)
VITTSATPVPTTTSSTTSLPATVPTPAAETCPTPGVYTFPATTITLTSTVTACAASTTVVPSGTWTLGGVTTVVQTATTVVCPYATTSTTNGVVTSVIQTTTYVCPSAGTYTIGPITTVVTKATNTVPCPVVSTYTPGVYSHGDVVVTVTETDYVYYCPMTGAAPAATTTQAAVAVVNAPAVATTASTKSSSSSSSGLGGSGGMWAITYTPYTTSGQCKTQSEVLTDVTMIKNAGFSSLRVYSTDCNTLEYVGAACESVGLKMIIGVFINEAGCENSAVSVADQVAAIKAWAKWDLVELCVIGNEALYNNYCTIPQLAGLITSVKSQFAAAGYSGPVTTTDVVSSYVDNDVSTICAAVDVVACNAHAYFNSATLASAAGAFVAGQLAIVEKICGKDGYVMETGWPSQGICNGAACAGASEQSSALGSIKDTIGDKVVYFTFGLDMWKDAGSCQCEPYFDCKGFFTGQLS